MNGYQPTWREAFKLLILAVCGVVVLYGGYWFYEHEFWLTIATAWEWVSDTWKTLSFYDVWSGLLAWFRRMWFQWLVIEVPKRLAIGFGLPYVALFLIGPTRRKRLLLWFAHRKHRSNVWRRWIRLWFYRHFGRFAGWAIGLTVAIAFGTLFWLTFGTFVFLWLGVKLPTFLVTVFGFIGRVIVQVAQKIPFRNALFALVRKFWMSFISMSWIPPWMRSDASMKRRRRAARWAIRRRYWKERRIRRTAAQLARLRGYLAKRRARLSKSKDEKGHAD